jgi:hypothetical protein
MFRSLVALAIFLSVQPAFGTLYASMDLLPQDKEYDYIVVGGKCSLHLWARVNNRGHLSAGIGGGVVAKRLAEDLNRNVLVIEAGIK